MGRDGARDEPVSYVFDHAVAVCIDTLPGSSGAASIPAATAYSRRVRGGRRCGRAAAWSEQWTEITESPNQRIRPGELTTTPGHHDRDVPLPVMTHQSAASRSRGCGAAPLTQSSIGCGQPRPHGDTLAWVMSPQINWEVSMPREARLATRATESAVETHAQVQRLYRQIQRALGDDGVIDASEARRIIALWEMTEAASRRTVRLIEQTDISELAVIAGLTGRAPAYLANLASGAGLELLVVGSADEDAEPEPRRIA